MNIVPLDAISLKLLIAIWRTYDVLVMSYSVGYYGYEKGNIRTYDDKQWRQIPTVLPDSCEAGAQDNATRVFMFLRGAIHVRVWLASPTRLGFQ
jgi:hypothetical protein